MHHPNTVADIVTGIQPINQEWVEKARARTAQLVMPPRALGRLHDISERLCGIAETLTPAVEKRAFIVMAGDHGIVEEGVSAFPQAVTGEMIKCFLVGGAGISVLARQAGADVDVVDMGIAPDLDPQSLAGGSRFHVHKIKPGTANFTKGPAMSREDAEQAVMAGFRHAARLVGNGVHVLGTGDMGIGNTTPSAAIGAVVTGAGLDSMVGRGTGIDDAALAKKKDVIRRGIETNRPNPQDGVDILSKIGGFEIGGIAGVILGAAYHRRPVVVDGFISTAGALIAGALCPTAADYMFAGHQSEEPGHRLMLAHLGLSPILDLGLRLGEGTGGAMAMMIMESAVRIFTEMLTFEEAGVSEAG
jgi:nicotinate-nucleotide--dimethylbenzimidazole phosphoribosyltransferase